MLLGGFTLKVSNFFSTEVPIHVAEVPCLVNLFAQWLTNRSSDGQAGHRMFNLHLEFYTNEVTASNQDGIKAFSYNMHVGVEMMLCFKYFYSDYGRMSGT